MRRFLFETHPSVSSSVWRSPASSRVPTAQRAKRRTDLSPTRRRAAGLRDANKNLMRPGGDVLENDGRELKQCSSHHALGQSLIKCKNTVTIYVLSK